MTYYFILARRKGPNNNNNGIDNTSEISVVVYFSGACYAHMHNRANVTELSYRRNLHIPRVYSQITNERLVRFLYFVMCTGRIIIIYFFFNR